MLIQRRACWKMYRYIFQKKIDLVQIKEEQNLNCLEYMILILNIAYTLNFIQFIFQYKKEIVCHLILKVILKSFQSLKRFEIHLIENQTDYSICSYISFLKVEKKIIKMTIERIEQIRIVSRPLASKLLEPITNIVQNLIQEFMNRQGWQHYAVIINTATQQRILHYIETGYTNNNIQDFEIYQYTEIYKFRYENFQQPIYLSDIENLSNNEGYSLINNSCIHFVNKVIIYLNERITNYDEKKNKIKLDSIYHMFNGILEESWKKLKILLKNLKELPKNFKELGKKIQFFFKKDQGQKLETNNNQKFQDLKNFFSMECKHSYKNILESLTTYILEQIIYNYRSQNLISFLLLFLIMGVVQFLSQLPIIGGLITISSILMEIIFIWSQKDDSILEKVVKTLESSFRIGLGFICNKVVQAFYRQCLRLTSVIYEKYKAKIIKLSVEDGIIVTTTTAIGAAIGTLFGKSAAVSAPFLTTPLALMLAAGFCIGLGIIWIKKKYF